MKRVGPQNASRHRTSSDLIGPNLNSVRFLRPEMSAQERTRCTQRVDMTRSPNWRERPAQVTQIDCEDFQVADTGSRHQSLRELQFPHHRLEAWLFA